MYKKVETPARLKNNHIASHDVIQNSSVALVLSVESASHTESQNGAVVAALVGWCEKCPNPWLFQGCIGQVTDSQGWWRIKCCSEQLERAMY